MKLGFHIHDKLEKLIEMLNNETILKSFQDLKSEKDNQLKELDEKEFPNRLDYLHDKAKLEDFVHICDEAIVALNKSSNVQEFLLDFQKVIDANISTGKLKDGRIINEGELIIARRNLPKSNETGGEDMSEAQITKKGRINGRIVAYTELKNLIIEFNTELAKDNAKQQGLLK